jgi:queuine tRNA-ribosyltransferase
MLGPILLTHHNLTYYQRLVAGARQAIEQDRFLDYFNQRMGGWSIVYGDPTREGEAPAEP